MTKLIFIAALLSSAAVASAQTAQTQTAQAPTPPIKDPDKRVCRSEVPTGSIMVGKRVCHTKAEWAALAQANGDAVDHFHANRRGGAMDNGGGFRPGS